MDLHIFTFVVYALLFSEFFCVAVRNTLNHGSPFNHGSIVCTRDQLLALRHTPLLCAEAGDPQGVTEEEKRMQIGIEVQGAEKTV